MLLHRSTKALPLCLALLASASCTERTLASKFIKTQLIRASTGGTLTVTAADSATYAGVSIKVPAGALAADTLLTVAPGSASIVPTGGIPAGLSVELGPSGILFSQGVLISLPYALPGSAQASELQIAGISSSGTATLFMPQNLLLDASQSIASVWVGELETFGAYISEASIAACQSACSSTCNPSPTTCYAGNVDYCNACQAACNGQSPILCANSCSLESNGTCTPVVSDGGPGEACLDQCTASCDPVGTICYAGGSGYCNRCVAGCYGVQPVPCSGESANGHVAVTYSIVDADGTESKCGSWSISLAQPEGDPQFEADVFGNAGPNTTVLPCYDFGGGTPYIASGEVDRLLDCNDGGPVDGNFFSSANDVPFNCVAGTTAAVQFSVEVPQPNGAGYIDIATTISANATAYPDGVCATVTLTPSQIDSSGTYSSAGGPISFTTTGLSADGTAPTNSVLACVDSSPSGNDWSYSATATLPTDCKTGAALDVQFTNATQILNVNCTANLDTALSVTFDVQ